MIIAILVLSIINVVFATSICITYYDKKRRITFNIPSIIIIVLTIIMLANNC
jgi:hypothetical protein